MPNRAERRKTERKKKALAKAFTFLNKTEEKRIWFEEGFSACRKACYASFAMAMKKHRIDTDELVDILRELDESVMFYAGEQELIDQAFEETGLLLNFEEIFSQDRIMKKEEPNAKDDSGDAGMAEDA